MDPSVISALSGAPPFVVLGMLALAFYRLSERREERHARQLEAVNAQFIATLEKIGERVERNSEGLSHVEKALVQLSTLLVTPSQAAKLPRQGRGE